MEYYIKKKMIKKKRIVGKIEIRVRIKRISILKNRKFIYRQECFESYLRESFKK